MYLRFDAISVLLATLSIVFLRRGRDGPSGAMMALAVLSKVWPLALVPIFVVQRRWRALAWFAAALAVGVISWVAYGGWDAVRQVGTFRGASGWQLGSTVGVLVWLATGQAPVLRQGARRVGSIPGWARPVLLVATVAIVAEVWRRARARAMSPEGVPALAAVAALIVLSPLLSIQYIAWLLPWAAIARADEGGAKYTSLCFAAAVLTYALWAIDRTELSPSHALHSGRRR